MSLSIQRSRPAARALLARLPVIGLILFFGGALIFGAMAVDLVARGPLLATDAAYAQSLHQTALASPGLLVQLLKLTFYLGREVITGATILLLIYWLVKRYWREFWMILLGVGGGGLWWYLLSRLFNRHRPVFSQPIELLTDPSFPSGHCIEAVLFYGLVAYLVVPRLKSGWAKGLVIALCLAAILLVGFGRLFVGSHYLTDVIAGYAFGLAWGGLVYTLVDLYFRRKG